MTTMKKILVSGASGIVGYGILRSLRTSQQPLMLIGSSIYDDSVAAGFCDIFELAPPTTAPHYIDWLSNLIDKHEIDLVIPGIEVDLHHWINHIQKIESSGARAMLNSPELVRLCQDKWSFYENLCATGLPWAIESSLENSFDTLKRQFGLPFLLKPRRGFGSKGIVRINDEATFEKYRHDIGSVLLAQPIIGTDDEEYTTSVFCDASGAVLTKMTLRRKLSRDGFTDRAEVVTSDQFEEAITDLCRHFSPLGPTNFQFRICAGGIKLLEVNPRISSSTSIRTAFGYNESAMAVDFFLAGKLPTQPDIRRGRAVRYVEEHIFYEDGIHL